MISHHICQNIFLLCAFLWYLCNIGSTESCPIYLGYYYSSKLADKFPVISRISQGVLLNQYYFSPVKSRFQIVKFNFFENFSKYGVWKKKFGFWNPVLVSKTLAIFLGKRKISISNFKQIWISDLKYDVLKLILDYIIQNKFQNL